MAEIIEANGVRIAYRLDGPENGPVVIEGFAKNSEACRKWTIEYLRDHYGDVELLIIKNERLEWLIRNLPQLTMELLKRLSEWLVATDREQNVRDHQTIERAVAAAIGLT